MVTRRSFMGGVSGLMATWPFGGGARAGRSAGAAPALPAPDDVGFWDAIRAEFLLSRDEVFFNSATLGSPPRVVVDRVADSLRSLTASLAEWDYYPEHPSWITGYETDQPVRRKFARVLNAAAMEEIALTQNATSGMNFIANGLELRPGDEIVSTDQEHPGGRCGWELRAKRYGVKFVPVALAMPPNDPGAVIRAMTGAFTPRTRVLAVAHITSALGIVLPVEELCHAARQRGIFSVIDGAQALGHVKVDVRAMGCDAWHASAHKWLLAPAGTGCLYVRGEHLPAVWTTLATSTWAGHPDGGFRLSTPGTGSKPLLDGLDAALDFHDRIGPDRIHARVKELGDHLRAGLQRIPRVRIHSSVHPAMCAGITTYGVEGMDGAVMQDTLWARGRMRPRKQGPLGVRHSTHIYNNEAEIDGALAIVDEMARRG